MIRFIPMAGIYSTTHTSERKSDALSVRDGLAKLNGLVDTAIVYFRPWMIEDGTLAYTIRDASVYGIRLIPGMRPDLAEQGHGTDQPWSQKNWDEVARLIKLAMRATKKRDFFLVMEPSFNPAFPPSRIDYIAAIKIAAYTGARLWFDRPYVDHANPDVGIGWLTDCVKHASSWWRPMRLAAAMPGTYSLLANPRSADEERWQARDSMHSILGKKYCHDRYFVTPNRRRQFAEYGGEEFIDPSLPGRWPGDTTTDYMTVTSTSPMFDFLDAVDDHEEARDAPPVAYIHTNQFAEVCALFAAASAESARR